LSISSQTVINYSKIRAKTEARAGFDSGFPLSYNTAVDHSRAFREALTERFGEAFSVNVPLSAMSSFEIGGPADFFYEARGLDDLQAAVALAVREKTPYYVIGGGSNMLFDDRGFRGLIIRNRAEGAAASEGRLRVLAGTSLSALLRAALRAGLTGLEFLAGIPGTLGGAVAGNAGAFGRCLGDVLETADILGPDGARRTLSRQDLHFGYRHSVLRKSGGIVLAAVLMSSPGDRKVSEALMRGFLEKRREKHPPWGTACAGSYFKNPCSTGGEKVAAGRLLEEVGARGMSVGGAAVYDKHCNFIINKGDATSRDVLLLAQELKERVLARFGIGLEEEVIHLPADARAA
jgi:UDP-N-acetylmuramate dehydrogenase